MDLECCNCGKVECSLTTTEKEILRNVVDIVSEKFYGVSAEELFNDIRKKGVDLRSVLQLKRALRKTPCMPWSITQIRVSNVRYWYCDVKIHNELKKLFYIGERMEEDKFRTRLRNALNLSHNSVEVVKKISEREGFAYRDFTEMVIRLNKPHSESFGEFLKNLKKKS